MRIISGLWRGRKIQVPDIETTRPTMDRTREAVFGMLRARDVLRDANVLDVFAGSGAYGFEALSQGAAHVTFFEQDILACQILKANCVHLNCIPQARLVSGDVIKAGRAGGVAPLAFFDPPYNSGLLEPALKHLAKQGWIDATTFLVLEVAKQEDAPECVDVQDARVYGLSKIILASLKI